MTLTTLVALLRDQLMHVAPPLCREGAKLIPASVWEWVKFSLGMGQASNLHCFQAVF